MEREFNDAVVRYQVPSLNHLALMPVSVWSYDIRDVSHFKCRSLMRQQPLDSMTPDVWLKSINLMVELFQNKILLWR